jgi:hypothetical protein
MGDPTQTLDDALSKLADLSDDEISKLSSPESIPVAKEEPVPPAKTEPETPPAEEETPPAEEKPSEEAEKPPAEGEQTQTKLVDPAKADGPDAFKGADTKPAVPPADVAKKPAPGEEKPPVEPVIPAGGPDYKAFHERVMAPFKANGKTIQLQSADEVIQLLQMGANYTKKMQELQWSKKFLMMLENNGLLDEAKLGFLIDLDKKNPEAIKKLLKDSNIDPIDVDTSKEQYKPGSHTVSAQEVSLASAIEDLNSQDGGKETLQAIHGWDGESKKALWEHPELLQVFQAHRINGFYAKITDELERRKALGQIPASTPFLAAYKNVGDDLANRGVLQPGTQSPPPAGQRPVPGAPVAIRPAKTPGTTVVDPRLKAAAPTRTSPRAAQAPMNYLAMSDDEFMKLPHNKL